MNGLCGVLVQDASGYVGQKLSLEMQARLLTEYGPERVLFKPEAEPIGPRLSELIEATQGEARVFEGSGGSELADSYRRGIVGTMPGAEMIDGIITLWRSLQAGDTDRVAQLAAPIKSLVAMQSGLDGFLAVEKYLLHKQNIFRNTLVRGPRGSLLDEQTRQEVDRLFATLSAAVGATA